MTIGKLRFEIPYGYYGTAEPPEYSFYALTIDSLNRSINNESLYEKTKTEKLLSEILMGRFLTIKIEGE